MLEVLYHIQVMGADPGEIAMMNEYEWLYWWRKGASARSMAELAVESQW